MGGQSFTSAGTRVSGIRGIGPAPAKAKRLQTEGAAERTDLKGRADGPAAERKLVERVHARWHAAIAEACAYSSLPAEFLGALIANESGGNPRAARFEPAVYRHLKAVAEGRSPAYASLRRESLEAEIRDMLHPKADAFHAAELTTAFTDQHRAAIAKS